MLIHLLGGAFWGTVIPTPGPAPSGAPTDPFVGSYGVPVKWSVGWTNTDPLAYTRVHRADLGDPFSASVFVGSANPGQTQVLTDDETEGAELVEEPQPLNGDFTYFIFHRRNGQDSATVSIDTTEA